MTDLVLAARNTLVQSPGIQALIADGKIARSTNWTDGCVFPWKPQITIEKLSHKAFLVISQNGTWSPPNLHNTGKFPRLFIDIWAAPTRDESTYAMTRPDADALIMEIADALYPVFHTIDMGVPGRSGTSTYQGETGSARWWGTADEVANKTGARIISSEHLDGPEFFDVADGGEGARMGNFSFGVSL